MVTVKRISTVLISFLIAGLAGGIGFASAELPNVEAKTPLMLAAESGHSEKVHALLERGADANARTAKNGTALMFAAHGGHAETAIAVWRGGIERVVGRNRHVRRNPRYHLRV